MSVYTIVMKRLLQNDEATLGLMNCMDFKCATLEDEYREEKVDGETRIPAGTYNIKLRTGSPMARKYTERYGDDHLGMLWLQDVPGFEYVYIHTGNREDQTDGCILVGMVMDTDDFTVGHSRDAYSAVSDLCFAALSRGDTVYINIEDVEL